MSMDRYDIAALKKELNGIGLAIDAATSKHEHLFNHICKQLHAINESLQDIAEIMRQK